MTRRFELESNRIFCKLNWSNVERYIVQLRLSLDLERIERDICIIWLNNFKTFRFRVPKALQFTYVVQFDSRTTNAHCPIGLTHVRSPKVKMNNYVENNIL